jgi:hypothetical protein
MRVERKRQRQSKDCPEREGKRLKRGLATWRKKKLPHSRYTHLVTWSTISGNKPAW